MTLHAKVIGVHPVEAEEPVYLIEILVEGDVRKFDFDAVTQDTPNQPRSNWQSAYDERTLEESDVVARYAFFFHYLDFDKPLLSKAGPLVLPKPEELPSHLQEIVYESP